MFNYTPKLVSLLANAQRLYGQLEAESEIPSLALRLTRENQALATHFSTSIEGNPLSQAEVTNIILGDKIPTTKSEQEVKNYFEVLNKISVLTREKKALSASLTLDLHAQLMKGLPTKKPGQFRNERYIVGHKSVTGELVTKHNPPAHTKEEIESLLKNLFHEIDSDQETHPLIKSGILHHQFVYIHPFTDGNGRLTRLLTSYYLLLHGYEVTKYFVLDDYYDIDRLQYSDMLHIADSGNKTTWIEYFLEGISYSLQAAMGRVEKMRGQVVSEVAGNQRVLVSRREEEVLQLLIDRGALKTHDLVEEFEVTRQQAQSILNSLVKKAIVEKIGKTKSSYYELVKKL